MRLFTTLSYSAMFGVGGVRCRRYLPPAGNPAHDNGEPSFRLTGWKWRILDLADCHGFYEHLSCAY